MFQSGKIHFEITGEFNNLIFFLHADRCRNIICAAKTKITWFDRLWVKGF